MFLQFYMVSEHSSNSSTVMTSTSSSMGAALGPKISEKLTWENYVLWKAQILPAIRGAQLEGILYGTTKAPTSTLVIKKDSKPDEEVPNPAYSTWVAQDQ
jgi:hypothetical protein